MDRDLNANKGRYHVHAIKILYEENKMQIKELLKLALMITILAIFSLGPWYAFSQTCPEGKKGAGGD